MRRIIEPCGFHCIKVNHLGVKIGEQTILEDVNLHIHCGSLNAVIGKNVNVGTGVTIGMENRGKRKGAPVIGDNCWIGTNAVIVGNIKIGNDVLIAPLTYVNFDIPDHSIVIGNPVKIIPRNDATADYVCNRV